MQEMRYLSEISHIQGDRLESDGLFELTVLVYFFN